jgi:uncharacterized membrane protein YccC
LEVEVDWPVGARRTARRVRSVGWRGWLRLERDVMLQIARTSLAAAVSWALASALLDSRLPALASLAAIIISQVTLYQTIARAVQYVIAVVLGVFAALLVAQQIGVDAWTIGAVIFVSLIVGRLLRLGQQANQVAISALLVLSLGTSSGAERAHDALLGAVVGVIVNFALPPSTYVDAAGRSLHGIAEDIGELCEDVADRLRGQWQLDDARDWLERARRIDDDVRRAGDAVGRGAEGVRYNPRAIREAEPLARYDEALRALDHVSTQVRGIVRTLVELADDDDAPAGAASVLGPLADVLSEGGQAARLFGQLQEHGPDVWGEKLTALRSTLTRAEEARIRTAKALHAVWFAEGPGSRKLGSLLVDAERLLNELNPDSGPHTGAVPHHP